MKRSNVNVCEKSSTKVTLNEEFSTVKDVSHFVFLYYQCQGFELSIKILPASWLINAKSDNPKDLNWNNIGTSSLMWAKKVVRQTGKFSNESTKNHFWKLISKQWSNIGIRLNLISIDAQTIQLSINTCQRRQNKLYNNGNQDLYIFIKYIF